MDDEIVDGNIVRRHVLYKTSNHCIMQSLSCESGLEDLYKAFECEIIEHFQKMRIWLQKMKIKVEKWKFESKNAQNRFKFDLWILKLSIHSNLFLQTFSYHYT